MGLSGRCRHGQLLKRQLFHFLALSISFYYAETWALDGLEEDYINKAYVKLVRIACARRNWNFLSSLERESNEALVKRMEFSLYTNEY